MDSLSKLGIGKSIAVDSSQNSGKSAESKWQYPSLSPDNAICLLKLLVEFLIGFFFLACKKKIWKNPPQLSTSNCDNLNCEFSFNKEIEQGVSSDNDNLSQNGIKEAEILQLYVGNIIWRLPFFLLLSSEGSMIAQGDSESFSCMSSSAFAVSIEKDSNGCWLVFKRAGVWSVSFHPVSHPWIGTNSGHN